MALAQRLDSLKKRHAQIEAILRSEEIRPAPDTLAEYQFKRLKLNLKDEMERLRRSAETAA